MGLCRDTANPNEAARAANGRLLWSCDGPGCEKTRVPWTRSWIWFGSYRDADENPFGILSFCCEGCRKRHEQAAAKIATPRN